MTDSTGVPCCGVVDLPNAVTVNETTTRYDARHRPIAQTVWLTPQGAVDPNNVPIAPVPSAAGLTTTWTYDDNLANGSGLDSYATGLSLGGGADGYAVAMTNPDNETSVTVYDGLGRVLRTVDGNGNATNTSYDTIVGNLVETAMACYALFSHRRFGRIEIVEILGEWPRSHRILLPNNRALIVGR